MADLSRKQGDTLLAYLKVRDPAGTAVDLEALGVEVLSQIRDARDDLFDVDVTFTTRGEEPAVRLVFDTEQLDVGTVIWDVQCALDGFIASTDTVSIDITPDVTVRLL